MENGKWKIDEKKLVSKILQGDRRAFEEFYREHYRLLYRFICSRVGSEADAQELTQDTFLGFLDSLPVFSHRSSLKTYLYSIARHEVADHYRRRYAKRALKLVPLLGDFVAEELYSTAELSHQIDRVYRKIMPEQAAILQLKYEDELSVKQIARHLKTTVKAAESKLFRARKAFQLVYLTGTGDT